MQDMTPAEVQFGLAKGDILLIDVREPHEFGQARIRGALNAPMSTLDPASLPKGDARQIVLQCGSGKRSGMALKMCAEAGLEITAHLAGGLGAWRKATLPVIMIDPSTGKLAER